MQYFFRLPDVQAVARFNSEYLPLPRPKYCIIKFQSISINIDKIPHRNTKFLDSIEVTGGGFFNYKFNLFKKTLAD
jgi:hypothetical protein